MKLERVYALFLEIVFPSFIKKQKQRERTKKKEKIIIFG